MTTINTNITSLNAQRNLAGTSVSLATAMQRLSSGLRVNSAKDDAAGLAIAERMNAQVRGMNVMVQMVAAGEVASERIPLAFIQAAASCEVQTATGMWVPSTSAMAPQPAGGPGKKFRQTRGLGQFPQRMVGRKVPLQGKPRRLPPGMPIVRHHPAQQHQVTALECPDVVTYKPVSVSPGEKCQLHFWMVMPTAAFTRHRQAPAIGQQIFHHPHRARPSDDAEGLSLRHLNGFPAHRHRHYFCGRSPRMQQK